MAGRVRYRELYPFILSETGYEHLNALWYKGGFPEAYLSASDADSMMWYANFVHSYVTRDLSLLGLSMQPFQVERLLQMLAHMHGQMLNYSNLSKSLGVSQPSIANAIYYLEEAMLIRTLKPWHNNTKKRLVKTPKVYIRDSGMLHYLLGINSYHQLLGNPQAGNSWEGFVIQQVISILPEGVQPHFYRTATGAELYLLLVKGNEIISGIEIKMSSAPQLTRGNTEAINDVKPIHQVVISPINGSFPLKEKWMVHSIGNFLKVLKNEI